MNSEAIFELAIGLKESWYIKEIKLKKPARLQRGQLDIYIDFKEGSKFLDEHGELSGTYESENPSRRHLNFFEHNCYIHARVPRIKQSPYICGVVVAFVFRETERIYGHNRESGENPE